MAAQYNVKPRSAIRSATGHFKMHKFDGLKVNFPPFSDEVITNLYLKIGQQRSRILTTDWPVHPVTGIPIVGEEFRTIDVPPNLGLPGATILQEATGSRGQPIRRAPTAEEKVERKNEIEAITAHNALIIDAYKACTKILSSRVSSSLNNKLLEFLGDPVRFWHYLKTTYGTNMLVGQNLGLEFLRVIAMQMAHAQRFNEFLLEFQRRTTIVQFTDDMRVGMILGDGSVGIHRVLPMRLEKVRELCETNNHDYATSCGIIMAHDDRQHEAGLPEETVAVAILAIKKGSHPKIKNTDPLDDPVLYGVVKCCNCENYCHTSPYCRLSACGKCKKFNAGHKSHECPYVSSKEGERKKGKKPSNKSEDNGKAPVKKTSSKKKEVVLPKSIPSDSEDEGDEVQSSSSSSEGESSDEVFPRAVRGQIRSIVQTTYGDVLGSGDELEDAIEFLDEDA